MAKDVLGGRNFSGLAGWGPGNSLERAPRWFLLSFLLLLGVLAYGPVLRVPFMWDDPQMILANPHITAWTWDNLKHNFTHDVFNQGIPYYRPLQTLLNMVDYTFYGVRPWGYHLTNLFLHLMNVLVLFLVFVKMRFSRTSAFWVAGAFAVHPIIVQELMVVAGRAELLSSFFVLLGLWGWLIPNRWGWGLSLLCFPLAILSKESGAVLPFLLVTVAATRFSFKDRWKSVVPHFALLGVYLILRHHYAGEVAPVTGFVEGVRFVVFQAPKILFVYVRLLLVPWNLHSHRYQPIPGWESLALFAGAVAGAVWFLKSPARRGPFLFWIGWFFCFLFPKVPLLATNSLMLEHWVYLAGVGVYGPGLIWLSTLRIPWVATIPLFFWMGMTQLNIHWRGSDSLNFAYSAQFSSSPWLRHNWGRNLLMHGYPSEAAIQFHEVLRRYPKDVQAQNGLALAYLEMGQADRAISVLQKAHREAPLDPSVLINLAMGYTRTGELNKALESAEQAVAMNPASPDALFSKAEVLRSLGHWPEAIEAYRATIRIHPSHCTARNNLAGLLVESGDYKGALGEMEEINRIDPGFPGVQQKIDRLNQHK